MAGRSERPSGELLAAISNLVVGVYADHLGRGPTKARTYIADNVVTCLLEDTLTKAEQTLLASGRYEQVLEIRSTLQETMRESLAAKMEELTGQRVTALICGNLVDPDITSQVFILDETSGQGQAGPT